MFIKIHILGKFGHHSFLTPTGTVTFILNTDSGGTNGMGQQCLIYYYYLPKRNGVQHNIRVRKQESEGGNETIDIVTNGSFNGWIKRQVSFSTVKPEYEVTYSFKACISFLTFVHCYFQIYFTFEKISGVSLPTPIIAIDEISVHLGSCRTYEHIRKKSHY
jgi:hypothetical protein